jgi:hypothetical protein
MSCRLFFTALLLSTLAMASVAAAGTDCSESLDPEAAFVASLASEATGAELGSAQPVATLACSVTASCGPFGSVSCFAARGCRAAHRNCAVGERGFVNCNGAITQCPPCSTTCPEGLRRYVATGNCCPGDLREVNVEECYQGEFVYLETTCSSQSCSGSSEL